jgi:ELWxxDGT repeat protein
MQRRVSRIRPNRPNRSLVFESMESRVCLAIDVANVANLNQTNPWGEVREIATAGALAYFTATEEQGLFLWRTDGASAGTVKLVDLSGHLGGSRKLTDVNGSLFFLGHSPTHGEELWSTQGTVATTTMIADLTPGNASSVVSSPTSFGGKLYFVLGGELYSASPTSASKVVDLIPSGPDGVDHLTVHGSHLYFTATDGLGRSLYRTSGTAATTSKLVNVPLSNAITEITTFGSDLLVVRNDSEVWRLNTTSLAASKLADLPPQANYASQLFPLGSTIYIPAGGAVWKLDSLSGLTTKVRDVGEYVSDFFAKDGVLYFSGGTEYLQSGYELWRSDGTSTGTYMIKDLDPGFFEGYGYSSDPHNFVVFNNVLYFVASNSVFKTDGTEAGTQLFEAANSYEIKIFNDKLFYVTRKSPYTSAPSLRNPAASVSVDIVRSGVGTGGSQPSYFTSFQGQTYFAAFDGVSGSELWRTYASGTPSLFLDLQAGAVGSSPYFLGTIGNRLVFMAYAAGKSGLWSTDGTAGGTQFLKEILYVSGDYVPLGNSLYFSAFTQNDGWELWKTDGSVGGTTMVKDINPGLTFDADTNSFSPISSFPGFLTPMNGKLYFRARSELVGNELWSTDGTSAGTVLVKDVYPGETFDPAFANDSYPTNFVVLANVLYFVATDETGRYLWRSNGTNAGTFNTGVIVNSSFELSFQMQVLGSQIVFTQRSWLRGLELWGTQGTPGTTVGIRDVRPGQASSGISSLYVAGDVAYFVADDGVNGQELWMTDGTTAGTNLVQDINPGLDPVTGLPRSSNPSQFTIFNGVLYFTAETAAAGRELWRTLGTAPGAVMVRDIVPGPASSHPAGLMASGRDVWFSASTEIGRELWRARVDPPDITGIASQLSTTSGAPPILIAGAGNIVDDNIATYLGGRFRVLISNPASALDQLGIQASGLLTFNATKVFYQGVEMARHTNTGRMLQFVLTSAANAVSTTALLRSITFATTNVSASPLQRRITLELWDGEGGGVFKATNVVA